MTRDEVRLEIIRLFKGSLKKQLNPGSLDLMSVHGRLLELVDHPGVNATHRIAREILQELVNNNVLFIGVGDDQHFPWFTLTEYGRECILADQTLPYDPHGYLVQVGAKLPTLDSETRLYLGEAVAAFNKDLRLSSAVALGVAAEQLVLSLIEDYISAHQDAGRRQKVNERFAGKFLFVQYVQFRKDFDGLRGSLPPNLTKDYETHLEGIFNLIRLVRNQSGHPTGIVPEKALLAANLQAFCLFAERILALQEYFRQAQL